MPLSKVRHREMMKQRRAELKATAQKILALSLPQRSGVLSVEERRQTLSKLANLPPEHSDPIKAIDVLNKMDNLYIQKTASLNVNLDLQAQLDQTFSLDELRALLAK